jgi:hypothetical protein
MKFLSIRKNGQETRFPTIGFIVYEYVDKTKGLRELIYKNMEYILIYLS